LERLIEEVHNLSRLETAALGLRQLVKDPVNVVTQALEMVGPKAERAALGANRHDFGRRSSRSFGT
jgi:hypothetical protein